MGLAPRQVWTWTRSRDVDRGSATDRAGHSRARTNTLPRRALSDTRGPRPRLLEATGQAEVRADLDWLLDWNEAGRFAGDGVRHSRGAWIRSNAQVFGDARWTAALPARARAAQMPARDRHAVGGRAVRGGRRLPAVRTSRAAGKLPRARTLRAQHRRQPERKDVLCQPPTAGSGWRLAVKRCALGPVGPPLGLTAAPAIRWVAARSGTGPDGVGMVTVMCCCRARWRAGS
jgi:hypothetical protein